MAAAAAPTPEHAASGQAPPVHPTAARTKRTVERRFALLAREVAATAEEIALTYEHIAAATSEDLGRAGRLGSRAEVEHREARRLWALADQLEGSGR